MDREHNKQKRFWRACVLGPLLALLLSGCGMFRPADNGPAPVKEHEHPLLAQQIDFRTPGRSLNRNAMIMTCDT